MVWAGDKKGNFTVRSAYRLAHDIEAEGSNSGCSDPSMMQGVWSLNVPNKIKHFVWKACNGILPTQESLYRRKITESKICEACGGRKKLPCMCSIFVTVEQRLGRKANLLCPAIFKSHGASWTLSVDFERAGWSNWGCWRGGFRSAGGYGRVEMRFELEARDNLAG